MRLPAFMGLAIICGPVMAKMTEMRSHNQVESRAFATGKRLQAEIRQVPDCDNLEARPWSPRDRLNQSPLGAAAQCGLLERVKELLAGGADPNGVSPQGIPTKFTPLIHAVTQPTLPKETLHVDQIEIIEELLQAGAGINKRGRTGTRQATALMRAAEESVPAVVKLLCERDAAVNLGDHAGQTPLMYALYNKRYGTANIEILLQYGAKVNVEDNFRHTVLDHALRESLPMGLQKQMQVLVPLLEANNAETHQPDPRG